MAGGTERVWIFGPVILALTFACTQQRSATSYRVQDEMGRPVALKNPSPKRIVSLAPNITEILYALDAGPLVIGVDNFSNFPPQTEELPHLGTDFQPSIERLVSLRPDLVFLSKSANRVSVLEALEQADIPVFVTRTELLSDLYRTIGTVGTLVGRVAQAQALVGRLKNDFAGVRAKTRSLPTVRVLLVVWNEPLFVVGGKSFVDELVSVAGGVNVLEDAGVGFPRVPLERVLGRAPEVILIGSHADQVGPDPTAFWRQWPSLPAVRTGRIHRLDGDLAFRPGPRVGQAARMLFAMLHPGGAAEPR